METAYEQAKEDIRSETKVDHVGLWEVVAAIRRWLPGATSMEVKELVLRCVKDLLEEGQVSAGFPAADGKGFEAWSLSPAEVVASIELVWDRLGREPTIGEIVWFHSVPKT